MLPSNQTVQPRDADAQLVARCLRREPGAFEELYRRHAPRVYSLACRLTGSPSEGEDLLQEVFLLVFRKLEGFKGDAALGTWIYRLATNCCVDYLRSRQHKARQLAEGFDERDLPAPARVQAPLRVDPLDLERAIAGLPPGYRAAFVLHDVEGFDHREVAALLGIAEGTSKSQVHKARMRIREALAAAPAGRA